MTFLICLPLGCGSSSHDDAGDSSAQGGTSQQPPSTSGGSSGSGGSVSAVEALIQDVSLGHFTVDTEVVLKGVFVTAKSGQGFMSDFWIQEPVGVTSADQEYPRHAGLQVFPNPSGFDLQFAVSGAKVGDCIDLTGTVGHVGGYPEISGVDGLVTRDPATCGTMPEPVVIDSDAAFEAIVSDADPSAENSQPAADAIDYNGLVLRVSSLTVKDTIITGGFEMTRDGSSGYLRMFPPFISGVYDIKVGDTFASVTGVYTNGVRLTPEFGLGPRTLDDLVQ